MMDETKFLSGPGLFLLEICAMSAKKKILLFTNSSLMITNGQVQLGRSLSLDVLSGD